MRKSKKIIKNLINSSWNRTFEEQIKERIEILTRELCKEFQEKSRKHNTNKCKVQKFDNNLQDSVNQAFHKKKVLKIWK